ncbi:MAG: AAA family ATPase [Candidatus Diapherotrites archaeon]|nr:AAA family ATPase [Candidatus Diapherotrites archaeon]
MIIIVSGFAGSGKSSLADSLGKHFNLRVIHASDVMKQLMKGELDLNNTKGQTGFWESNEAHEIMKKRTESDDLDKKLDEILLKEIQKNNLVLDSWTMPWLSEKGIKIWLNASPEVRAKRVSSRDSLDFNEVLMKIKERDSKTKAIYKRIYNFSLGEDLNPFHIILETNKINEKQVLEKALKKIKEVKENGEN